MSLVRHNGAELTYPANAAAACRRSIASQTIVVAIDSFQCIRVSRHGRFAYFPDGCTGATRIQEGEA